MQRPRPVQNTLNEGTQHNLNRRVFLARSKDLLAESIHFFKTENACRFHSLKTDAFFFDQIPIKPLYTTTTPVKTMSLMSSTSN